MPSVTVIVPVRNEARSIEQTLRSLLTQDFPPGRVRGDRRGRRVRRTGRSPSSAGSRASSPTSSSCSTPAGCPAPAGTRRCGTGRRTSRWSWTATATCRTGCTCANLSAAFAASGADCLGRPQPLDAADPTPFQRAVSAARASRLGHNPESDIFSDEAKFVPPQSTAVAYTRKVFHTIGAVRPAVRRLRGRGVQPAGPRRRADLLLHPGGEDRRTTRGRRCRACSANSARYGWGRARLAFKHPHSLSLPALVPPLWAVWLAVGGLLSPFVPYLGWLWAGSVGLYLAVLTGAAVTLGRGKPRGVARRIPLVIAGIHFGFARGFLGEVWGTMRRRAKR